ncbi:N-acetylmuramidase domain-containing protein [Robbsia sp. KACC 23696]|uniref:LysM peptidoglycan-binding domain-containing protein n=1 Tax=Robbsia sp. KACC 23696 TaxID=3149231 RepID=UPI00325A8308
MANESTLYTIESGDTLSGIAHKEGVAWQTIANINNIRDPRSLRIGQVLKIPRKVGKVKAHVLDADHNPLRNVNYKIVSGGKTVSGTTGATGETQEVTPFAVGDLVELVVQKLDGTWKKIYQTESDAVDKLVTLVSPRLKISMQTLLHPPESKSPGESSDKKRQPKAPAQGAQTLSTFAPGKGVKTEQTKDAQGAPVTKVTSDDASFDDFLDTYSGETITEQDFIDAAKALGCEVNVIKAVHETEAGAGSFKKVDGRMVPTILYERHYFYKYNGHKYWDTNPDLSYPYGYYAMGTKYIKKTVHMVKTDGTPTDVDMWVRFNKKKDKEHADEAETGAKLLKDGDITKDRDTYSTLSYKRLKKAYKLDASAALKSCSWGAFQIMGANFAAVGYASVEAMVRELSKSERPHLKAFIAFIKSNKKLMDAVRNKDFTEFALNYNGPGYKQNDYDGTMKKHYDALVAKDAAVKKG